MAESILEVMGPDAIKVLGQAAIPLSKASYAEIILRDDANAGAWWRR